MPLFSRRYPTPEPHYEYDGHQSVMIVKAAAKHIFESVVNQVDQYVNDRIVPAHYAYPGLTLALEILVAALIFLLYCRTIARLLVVGLLLAALHAWVAGHS